MVSKDWWQLDPERWTGEVIFVMTSVLLKTKARVTTNKSPYLSRMSR
jgi:hypothetical protein